MKETFSIHTRSREDEIKNIQRKIQTLVWSEKLDGTGLKAVQFQLSFNGRPELPHWNYCQRHHTWTLLRASLIQIAINVLHVYRESVCACICPQQQRQKTRQNSSLAKKWHFSSSSLDNSVLLWLGHKFCFKNLLRINIMKKVKEVVLCLLNIFH